MELGNILNFMDIFELKGFVTVLSQCDGGKDVLLMYSSSPVLVDKLKDSSATDITPTGEVLFGEYYYMSSCSAKNQSDEVKKGLLNAGNHMENCEWLF